MNASKLIEIDNLSAKQAGVTVLQNINLIIKKGEQWALLGNSGSGKTSLAQALTGKLFYSGHIQFYINGSIELVEQHHRFRTLSNTTDFYYQQRFQSQDSEDSLTVEQELLPFLQQYREEAAQYIQLLKLDTVWDEPLIQLSNGENKRVQLAKALLQHPAMLILDNPFTGLDDLGRTLLHHIINSIAANGMHLLLITSPEEIPDCMTNVAVLDEGRFLFSGNREDYQKQNFQQEGRRLLSVQQIALLATDNERPFVTAVNMVNTTIRYGDKIILDNINWEIQKGERWSVSGPNGAGKSTLLSLITADNPQAYANEIYLFDKRRGRGESIWDIKRNIGLVSPEMHLYFPYTSSCYEVIASGLLDTVGLFRRLSEEQHQQVQEWIGILQLKEVANKTLQQISMGHQRMALLARALVKNPPLLVLDEPCQGLDNEQIRFFNDLVDQLCTHFNTTLIYVSHYQHQLPACIDHYLRLERGRILSKDL